MKEVNSYLKGIVDIISTNIFPSYIVARSYKNISDFYNEYKISKDKIEVEIINDSYDSFIKETLNLDNKYLETFIYLINKIAGKCNKIYYLAGSELEKKIIKYVTFYMLDEVYIIEYENMCICYIIGNNE